jgi:release factor glutamine methyltransferase
MTIHDRTIAAAARLAAAGIARDEAERDARLLARTVLGWDAARLLASAPDAPPPYFADQYEALIDRRSAREPLAYVVGHQEFWGLDFSVSPAVLIPRPETELAVETALELFPDRERPLRIADVGTGSGCIAVALAHERPNAEVLATDISEDALSVARQNAERYGVSTRIEFTRRDLLNHLDRVFDLIVANPPYVPERDRPALQPEVRDHEPSLALFAGPDGLAVIERLLQQAADHLDLRGLLIMEFGFGQSDQVRALVQGTPGLEEVRLREDLQGIPRILIAVQSQSGRP